MNLFSCLVTELFVYLEVVLIFESSLAALNANVVNDLCRSTEQNRCCGISRFGEPRFVVMFHIP